MPAPEAIPGVPPGLEYLAEIDQLLVHQQIEILECKYRSMCSVCLQNTIFFGLLCFGACALLSLVLFCLGLSTPPGL